MTSAFRVPEIFIPCFDHDIVAPANGPVRGDIVVGTKDTLRWSLNRYRLRRKVWSLKNPYWLEDDTENKLGFTNRKAFALRDEI